LTGGVTIVLFLVVCLCTAVITVLAYQSLARMHVGARGVAIRGMSPIASLFGTWFLFCVAGFMHFAGSPPSVDLEMAGGIMASMQAIIDFWICMRLKIFRRYVGELFIRESRYQNHPSMRHSRVSPSHDTKTLHDS
jgi:hypothetical protein